MFYLLHSCQNYARLCLKLIHFRGTVLYKPNFGGRLVSSVLKTTFCCYSLEEETKNHLYPFVVNGIMEMYVHCLILEHLKVYIAISYKHFQTGNHAESIKTCWINIHLTINPFTFKTDCIWPDCNRFFLLHFIRIKRCTTGYFMVLLIVLCIHRIHQKINPFPHRYSFLRLLLQTTFENIVQEQFFPLPQCFQSFLT